MVMSMFRMRLMMKSSHVSVVWMSQSSFGLLQLLHHTFITVVPGNFITQGQICYSLLYYISQCCVFCFIIVFLLFRNPAALQGKYASKKEGKFPCLAEYGGPVDPNTALGGFPS